MTITNWPLQERPREKLLSLGPQSLSDAELLAIFLRVGTRGKTAVDLARDLLNEFESLPQLFEANLQRFCEKRGLGKAKYAQLQAILEMSKRYLNAKLLDRDVLTNSQDTRAYLTTRLRSYTHEVFACLFLDNRNRILAFEELFHGTIDKAHIHPRTIIQQSLAHKATAVIFAHNHPSGSITPSYADQQITEYLIKALEFIGVRVLDHFIVGDGEISSFVELGLL